MAETTVVKSWWCLFWVFNPKRLRIVRIDVGWGGTESALVLAARHHPRPSVRGKAHSTAEGNEGMGRSEAEGYVLPIRGHPGLLPSGYSHKGRIEWGPSSTERLWRREKLGVGAWKDGLRDTQPCA